MNYYQKKDIQLCVVSMQMVPETALTQIKHTVFVCNKQNKERYCCNGMVVNLMRFLSWRQIDGEEKGG